MLLTALILGLSESLTYFNKQVVQHKVVKTDIAVNGP